VVASTAAADFVFPRSSALPADAFPATAADLSAVGFRPGSEHGDAPPTAELQVVVGGLRIEMEEFEDAGAVPVLQPTDIAVALRLRLGNCAPNQEVAVELLSPLALTLSPEQCAPHPRAAPCSPPDRACRLRYFVTLGQRMPIVLPAAAPPERHWDEPASSSKHARAAVLRTGAV
jgi:hypothetical protein